LLELLVVIAIVATLFGVLLPALSAAKKSAQWNRCRSNLGQLGLLTEGVMDKYGMNFPYFEPGKPGDPASLRLSMEAAFEGVAPPGEYLICPSDPDGTLLEGWDTSYRYFPGETIENHPVRSGVGEFDGVRVRFLPGAARSVWGDSGNEHGNGRSNSVAHPDWVPR